MHAVFMDKLGATSQPVPFESEAKVIRYADVQGTVSATRKNIDIVEHDWLLARGLSNASRMHSPY
jgi:hypothetical protein